MNIRHSGVNYIKITELSLTCYDKGNCRTRARQLNYIVITSMHGRVNKDNFQNNARIAALSKVTKLLEKYSHRLVS